MQLRKALTKDLDQIWNIYNQVKLNPLKLGDSDYEADIQKKGFLTGLSTKEEILSQIQTSWLFLVAEEENIILGFTIVEQSREYKDDDYKTWFDFDLKEIYYTSSKMLAILSLAVDPAHAGKGIATNFLDYIETDAKKSGFEYLFTVITISPVTNCPMISWRTKVGFKRLAMGKPREELFGMKWYSSLLMYKKLK